MSHPTLTPFADLLREHRLARRLTQGALAERARMSVDAISALERGFRRAPQRATVAMLAAGLALEGDELLAFESAAGAVDTMPAPRRRAPKPVAIASPLRDGVAHLIGRDAERQNVRASLALGHIVTICGTGGIGKTELALAVAHDIRSTRAFDEVRFVALAPLSVREALGDAVARAFALPTGMHVADLAQALAARRALLVLDNCEHVAAAAATLALELTRDCPGLAILATSRKPLGVADETIIALAPLDAHAAVALFVERAREVDARFALHPQATSIVADICRRLDGIALAIEIAARRTRVLSIEEIYARLDRRFRLLINERAREDRQRTLEALVAWSYDLLQPREQRFFDRLSIFPDGFTLEAAHAVALADDGDDYDALDLLETLVTNSLAVRGTSSDGTTRYGLLETLRAYGSERLHERGEGADVRRRLLAYVDVLFTAGGTAFEREARVATLARLDVERETFAAALDAASELGEEEAGARLFARIPALRRWLRDDDIASRAAHYLEALAHVDDRAAERTRGLIATLEIRLGNASSRIDAPRSLPAFERALAHARLASDEHVLGRALVANALGLMRLRRFDEAGIALDEAVGCNTTAEARKELRHTRALLALYRGEGDAAAAAFGEIADAERALGNAAFEFDALHSLAEAHVVRGDIEAAREAAELAEPLLSSVGPHPRAAFQASRAAYACFSGDALQGLRFAREALEIRPRDNVWPQALRHAALACALLGHIENAARLDGRAAEHMRVAAFAGYATERIARDRLAAMLVSELGETRARALRLEGARANDDMALASLPLGQLSAARRQQRA